MNLSDINRLYAFNRWANARFFDAAAALTPEQYGAELLSSFPSIRDTLAHIVAAEWIWLERWQGNSPTEIPPWAKQPALTELKAQAEAVEGAIGRFLASTSEDDLRRIVSAKRLNGEVVSNALGDLLVHVVNHGTYHRGQLTTLIRQVGATPPSTDLTVYLWHSSRTP